ncbi:DUF551 domain-containing protein [Citrobacter freundii]
MSTFTKEQLIEKLQHRISVASRFPESEKAQMDLELARIALASIESEPVYQYWCYTTVENSEGDQEEFWFWNDCDKDWFDKIDCKKRMLFTAPPAPVAVPAAMEMDDDFDSAFEHGKAVGWNACRAAMLQSFGNSEQLNSPVIPDGWVACVERMPSAGEQVLAYRQDAPESNDPLIKMATYVGGSAHGHGFDCYCKPTHWMPLPAAPQQEA